MHHGRTFRRISHTQKTQTHNLINGCRAPRAYSRAGMQLQTPNLVYRVSCRCRASSAAFAWRACISTRAKATACLSTLIGWSSTLAGNEDTRRAAMGPESETRARGKRPVLVVRER
eukprot:scaffold54868_cov61-Phaeocystis_antarctica.AAC.6